jgi:hypothetical protein
MATSGRPIRDLHASVNRRLLLPPRSCQCTTAGPRISGSARTRHCFGDEVGAAVSSSWHAETAAGPRGDHHRACTTPARDGRDRRLGHHWAVGRRGALRSLEKQTAHLSTTPPMSFTRSLTRRLAETLRLLALMIIWILFGHLMTLRQHKTTAMRLVNKTAIIHQSLFERNFIKPTGIAAARAYD